MDRSGRYWIAGIVIAAASIYLPYIGHSFINFDDDILIVKNSAVQELSLRSVQYMFSSYDPELYVPLTMVSFQITHALAGLTPWAYHIFNLVLHIGSATVLFFILRTLFQSSTIAGITAVLFAVHPINVEAVLWASARKDVLSSFLFFSSWWLYVWYHETGRQHRYWLSVGIFLLALLAKVSVLILPAILLLSDWAWERPIDRTALHEKVPYLILSGIFAVVAVMGKAAVLQSMSVMDRFLLTCKTIAFYAWKMLFPSDFSLIYPQTAVINIAVPEFWMSVIATLLLVIVTMYALWRWRIVGFALSIFLLAILPSVATFYKNGFVLFASDRYAYIAGIGVFLCIAMAINTLLQRGMLMARSARYVAAMILVGCGVMAGLQARVWQSPLSIFENVLAIYPESVLAHNNIGAILQEQGKRTEAVEYYKKAIAIDPLYPTPYVNIAKHVLQQGDRAGAESWYRDMHQQLQQKDVWSGEDANAIAVYALFLEDQNRLTEAVVLYEEAAERYPYSFQTQSNLGIKYQQLGRKEDAINHLEAAVEFLSSNADIHYRLAALYAETGRFEEALASLKRVLRLDPGNAKARQHFDAIQGRMKQESR